MAWMLSQLSRSCALPALKGTTVSYYTHKIDTRKLLAGDAAGYWARGL